VCVCVCGKIQSVQKVMQPVEKDCATAHIYHILLDYLRFCVSWAADFKIITATKISRL